MNPAQIATILAGSRGVWSATPWNYSSLRFLTFNADGSGEFVYGYGQTIYAIILCRWEILKPDCLLLTYLPSPAKLRFPGFTPDPDNGHKELECKLLAGMVTGTENIVALPYTFHWTLELSDQPWPAGLNLPNEIPRVFFGHRQMAATT